jgi:hypothetical protein
MLATREYGTLAKRTYTGETNIAGLLKKITTFSSQYGKKRANPAEDERRLH